LRLGVPSGWIRRATLPHPRHRRGLDLALEDTMRRHVPFLGWLLLILATLYAIYNPLGACVLGLWLRGDEVALPVKLLVTAVPVALLGLYVYGTWRAIGLVGIAILSILLGLVLWVLAYYGVFDPADAGLWSWMAQPLLAVVLAVGFQWSRIWRGATGQVSVDDIDAHGRETD
jgi:Family of unknown function (DUF6524)